MGEWVDAPRTSRARMVDNTLTITKSDPVLFGAGNGLVPVARPVVAASVVLDTDADSAVTSPHAWPVVRVTATVITPDVETAVTSHPGDRDRSHVAASPITDTHAVGMTS